MGRAQQARTNEMNDTTRLQAGAQYNDFNRDQSNIGQEYLGNARSSFGSASGVYNNLAQGFGPGDQNYGSGGGGGGGGVSAEGYTAKTYNAEGYNTSQPQYHLRGIDPSNLAEAKAGYGEFAKTGGMDDAAQQNFRARGNATLPSFYSNLRNNMATRRNVQGGYGSGFDAADAALARQAGQATYQGQLGTEGSLQDTIRQGRQFGIAGQADVGKFADTMQLQHDTQEGQFSEAYAGRQDTAGMFSAGERNRAGMFNAGEQNQASAFGANARNSASAANASIAAQNAGLAERAREFNADQDFQRRNAAGSGFSGLYSDSNQGLSAAGNRWLGGLTGQDQMNRGAIDSRFNYNRPWGQQLANSLVSGGASAAGAYFGGYRRPGRPTDYEGGE